jgi:BirA family biotin operon repressor/biotin-[acetyl-CoA-carboxylase] ligase
VLGVGINVAHHPGLGGAYPSTALRAEGASIGGTEPVLASYLDGFAAWYDRWRSDGFEAIRAAWRGRALGLGGPVTVRLERETLSGRFVDLDGTGALVIGTAEGAHRSIAAGDVAFASVPQVDRAAGD